MMNIWDAVRSVLPDKTLLENAEHLAEDAARKVVNDAGSVVKGAAKGVVRAYVDGAGTLIGASQADKDEAERQIYDGADFVGEKAVGLATGDTYFPDNPAREARARELVGDINQINDRVVIDNAQVKTALAHLTATIESIYHSLGKEPPKSRTFGKIDLHANEYEVAEVVAPVLGVAGVSVALRLAGGASLGTGPGIALALAITAVVGLIQGEQKRDQLQTCIRDGIRQRRDQKIAELTLMRLLNVIQGVSSAIETLPASFDPQKVADHIAKVVSHGVDAMKVDPGATAGEFLGMLDRERHSWTNEDGG